MRACVRARARVEKERVRQTDRHSDRDSILQFLPQMNITYITFDDYLVARNPQPVSVP